MTSWSLMPGDFLWISAPWRWSCAKKADCDGFMAVDNSTIADFKLHFYNADGSIRPVIQTKAGIAE